MWAFRTKDLDISGTIPLAYLWSQLKLWWEVHCANPDHLARLASQPRLPMSSIFSIPAESPSDVEVFTSGNQSWWVKGLTLSQVENCEKHSRPFDLFGSFSENSSTRPIATATAPLTHPLSYSSCPCTPASWNHLPNKLTALKTLLLGSQN